MDLAKEFGIPFFETSGKIPKNIEDSFISLVNKVKNSVPLPMPEMKKKGFVYC